MGYPLYFANVKFFTISIERFTSTLSMNGVSVNARLVIIANSLRPKVGLWILKGT